jgi:uncharacterized membrane protein
MQEPEIWLARWQSAGLLDETSAAAIRAYEKTHAAPSSRRWQVVAALILGGILLGAGVLLFVAAHWDAVSPFGRMVLVLAMLCLFHVLGLVTRSRFAGFATAMHATGTISAGAAIALVGQIFNMQGHWPAAIMLWAICAAAGWVLLGDAFQQTLTLLLVPAWIASEWLDRSSVYGGGTTWLARLLGLVGAAYLTAFLRNRTRGLTSILFAAGAVLLPCAVFALSEGWSGAGQPALPFPYHAWAIVLSLLTVGAGWLFDRKCLPVLLVVAGVVWALPWLPTVLVEKSRGSTRDLNEADLLSYALVGAMAVFLVWWGIRNLSRAVVNYGMAGFALTVMWFYFSSILDKLDRSLGLIVLGILFLAGGWALEYTRRRIVAGIGGGA